MVRWCRLALLALAAPQHSAVAVRWAEGTYETEDPGPLVEQRRDGRVYGAGGGVDLLPPLIWSTPRLGSAGFGRGWDARPGVQCFRFGCGRGPAGEDLVCAVDGPSL